MKFRATTMVLALVAVTLFNFQFANAQGMEFFDGTWEEAKATAKKENKSIFLDAYASWCGPCKNMAKHIFTEGSVGEFYNDNFINVKIDMEKGEGIALSEEFAVVAFPTYLYFNTKGELVHRALGQKPVKAFIGDGENALNESTQLVTLENRYAAGNREADLLRNLALALYDSGAEPKAVDKVSAEYINGLSKEEIQGKEALAFLLKTTQSPKAYPAQLLLNNKDKVIELFGKDEFNTKFKRLAAQGTLYAARDKDVLALEDAKSFASRALGSDLGQFNQQLDMLYAERTEDWDLYTKSATKYYDTVPTNELSWNELNTVAWNFFLHVDGESNLKNALGWAEQSVKFDSNSYNLDTQASLLYKMGKHKKALKVANKAIGAAKEEGLSPDATMKLVKEINMARGK